MKPAQITCPYCNGPAEFLPTSESIYAGRDFGPIYRCAGLGLKRPEACDAYVGAHRETLQPLGRLANRELRRLKVEAHAYFDPLWRDLNEAYPELSVFPGWMHHQARSRAYAWLASRLGIPMEHCHIAAFGDFHCRETVALIRNEKVTSATVRAWAKKQVAA